MTWQLSLLTAVLFLAPQPAPTTKKPVEAKRPDPRPATTRTYRFTAKIVHNGGVTPFKVGTKITGQFTYDLSVRNQSKLKWSGIYRSPRNKIEISYGKLRFSSQEIVHVAVASSKKLSEAFSISGGKLKLPKGWRSEPDTLSGQDKSYVTVFLQNRPPRGVLSNTKIPDRLDAWQRFKSRTVVLDFADGVRFPGGNIDKRVTVYFKLEGLELIKP